MTAAAPLPAFRLSPAALGWTVGLAGPPLGLAALAGGLLAASHPPLNDLTGLGRWTLAGPFAMAAMALGMWVMAGPTTALLYLALRRAGVAAALLGGAAGSVAALALLSATLSTGGPGGPRFWGELARWALLWSPACAGCTVWLHLSLTAFRRLSRRRADGAAPRPSSPPQLTETSS